MGFDFYCDCAPPTVSLWLLLCLWMCQWVFGEFQCLPVNDRSAVSCDSVLSQEGVNAHPSTLPSWANLPWIFKETSFILVNHQSNIQYVFYLLNIALIHFTVISRPLGLNVPHIYSQPLVLISGWFPRLNSIVIKEHTVNNFRLPNFAEAFFIGPTHSYSAKCSTRTLKEWIMALLGAVFFFC